MPQNSQLLPILLPIPVKEVINRGHRLLFKVASLRATLLFQVTRTTGIILGSHKSQVRLCSSCLDRGRRSADPPRTHHQKWGLQLLNVLGGCF